MARPSKLTKEVSEKICQTIRAGNYPAVSALSCGISESTFYRWMEEGRATQKGAQHDFYLAVKRAEAEGEARAVALIAKLMKEDWKAAMAFLERRHGERWGRRDRFEPSVAEERPPIDLTKLSERELKLLEKIDARPAE
jgi:hypothetical protein